MSTRTWTETVFDGLGRPTYIAAPDSEDFNGVILPRLAETSIAYDGLKTITTNPLGQTKTEEKNGLGELVKVTDAVQFSTNYTYDAAGNLSTVWRDAGRGVITTSMGYDRRGRKIWQSDPDAGDWSYTYNALGELLTQIHADGAKTVNLYDARGRVYERKVYQGTTLETTSSFVFDTASNGVGQLASDSISGNYVGMSLMDAVSQSRTYGYDGLGRGNQTSTTIDGVTYATAVAYDTLGRPQRTQDASGEWSKTEFTARGYAIRVCASSATDLDPACASGSPNTWVETLETDARGNVIQERRVGNNNLMVKRSFDPWSGRPIQLCAGSATGDCAQLKEDYRWDVGGNLTWRDKGSYKEEFRYDALNRLTEGRFLRLLGQDYAPGTGPLSVQHSYDQLGNICSKLEGGQVQHYGYAGRTGCGMGGLPGSGSSDSTRSPHQVTSALGAAYQYDARGNQTLADRSGSSDDRHIRYSQADQAIEIAKGSATAPTQRTRFWYGADGQRYKREEIAPNIAGTRCTYYVGGVEVVREGCSSTATPTFKRMLAGLLQERKGTTVTDQVLLNDHLGSLVKIVSPSGGTIAAMDFAAFGQRRSLSDPRQYGIAAPTQTNRGFTGHEHVDGLDVIHMNGRIYDPRLGRFLQADPIIQDPTNGQNFNRYTYVWNNPLAFTDPSGFLSFSPLFGTAGNAGNFLFHPAKNYIRAAFRAMGPQASSVAVGVGCGFAGPWAALCAAGGGYDMTRAFGGSQSEAIKAGLNAAFSVMVFRGIGANYDVGSAGHVAASAMAGGVLSVLQGGKFGHGFVSAGITAGVMPHVSQNAVAGTVVSAIIGGTASALTGGKFANGAITAAMSYAMSSSAQGKLRAGRTPGSVDVRDGIKGTPSTFAGDVADMLAYLEEAGSSVMSDLRDHGVDVIIQYKKDTFSMEYGQLGGNDTLIVWADPRSGLQLSGGIQSPALSLYHELVHGYRAATGVAQYHKNGTATDWEETQVISAERRLAQGIYEPYRFKHNQGNPVSASPVCGYGGC